MSQGIVSCKTTATKNSTASRYPEERRTHSGTHSGHNLGGVEAAFNGQSNDEEVRFHRLPRGYLFLPLSLFLGFLKDRQL